MNEQLLLSATRQHELTETAEKANHLKDEFLTTTLSHELRTPLTSFALPELNCPPELDGLRVLVVDDEADTCELLQVILEGCGARVKTASSAAAALEAVAEEVFEF